MTHFMRVRPSARGAAEAVSSGAPVHACAVQRATAPWPPLFGRLGLLVRIGSNRLALASALAGLALPIAASATPAPAERAAAHAGQGELTLYSEPGLRGRHATYKTATQDVERQGFVARSAASTGMWTLCEGGEVASRCQTVQGQAPELRLAPQIARPGLNALALYDQPGLKGRRLIYSFAADRPAPFHARSAQTWGGPWSLCERGFKHCQTLAGRTPSLDLVVEAVRPEADSAEAQASEAASPTPVARPVARAGAKVAAVVPVSAPPPAKSRSADVQAEARWVPTVAPHAPRPAAKAPEVIEAWAPPAAKSRSTRAQAEARLIPAVDPPAPRAHRAVARAPAAIRVSASPSRKSRSTRSEPARSRSPDRAPRPPRLVHVDAEVSEARAPERARPPHLVPARAVHRAHQRAAVLMVRESRPKAMRPPHRGIVIEFVDALRGRRADTERRWAPAHVVRTEVVARHPPHTRLVHHVADRRGRAAHIQRRSDYRRVHMTWGGADPYLYDVDPRGWEAPARW